MQVQSYCTKLWFKIQSSSLAGRDFTRLKFQFGEEIHPKLNNCLKLENLKELASRLHSLGIEDVRLDNLEFLKHLEDRREPIPSCISSSTCITS